MLILRYFNSFAITYPTQSASFKNLIFQSKLCLKLHKIKMAGNYFSDFYFHRIF